MAFGFAFAVPVILLNTFLWMRFTSVYAARSSEKMPFLTFDFGGRWQRALARPHPDPSVERLRRQLRISQFLLFAPFVIIAVGVPLATGSR